MGTYRAVVYVRVSTEEQATEGFSLAAQEDRCKSFIQSQGWEFIKLYKDDGYSAKNLDRPAMNELIKDMKNDEFDVIVVYRLDRLVRSVIDLHHLLQLLDEHKISFKSVTEVFDTTTAMGRFFITLVAAMAQWERENLAERIKMGQERRALEGKRNLSKPPIGYDIGENGGLVVNHKEAEIVKRIFALYKHYGVHNISRILNSEKVFAKSGATWSDETVSYVLSNVTYTGKLKWGYQDSKNSEPIYYDGVHEPIIDQKTFEEIQKIAKERKGVVSAKALTSDYPFSGILKCARCGYTIHGARRKYVSGYYYHYICRGHHKRGLCDMPNISEKSLEKALFSKLALFIEAKDYEPPPKEKDTVDTQIKSIQKEIEVIKKRRKKWQLAFANEAITLEDLKELTAEDKKREQELKELLTTLPNKQEPVSLTKDEFINLVNNINVIWDAASRQERKELVHSLIKSMTIDTTSAGKKGYRNPVIIVDYELN